MKDMKIRLNVNQRRKIKYGAFVWEISLMW